MRDHVKRIQAEVRPGDLSPELARERLLTLSALYGNILDEMAAADAAYAHVLLAHLDSDEAANRAKIRAETSPEYARVREAKNTEKLVQELTRALKYYLRSQEEEMRLSR